MSDRKKTLEKQHIFREKRISLMCAVIAASCFPVDSLAADIRSNTVLETVPITLQESEITPAKNLPWKVQRRNELLKSFSERELPPESATDHEKNKTLSMNPIKLGAVIQIASLAPRRLDASYNEPISLRDALNYAMRNNLPIKISEESLIYQKSILWSDFASFLPSFSVNYGLTHSDVYPDTKSNANVFLTRLNFPVFTGGSVLYSTLAQVYRVKGWKEAYKITLNDTLLDVYQRYTNLILNHTLLKINAKSLEVSKLQLQQNERLFEAGTGTKFAIMQSRTQLANDRQALLAQQVTTRQAALLLANSLNMPLSANLIPVEESVSEQSIVDERLPINQILSVALKQRPELRQYEDFRLASLRNVQVGASPLYPTAAFFVQFSRANTTYRGDVNALNGTAVSQISLSGLGSGTASNVALGQAATFSPGSNSTAQSGANTGAATTVAASGGTPIATTQSGSLVTSGAVAPSIIGGGGGSISSNNINGTNTSTVGVFPGLFNTLQCGFSLTWSLSNMGLNSVANVISLRALARQSLLQANQEIMAVSEQVRSSYLTSLAARKQIDTAASSLESATEALRLADLRLQAGTGTNLELIQAQRDYVVALTSQAQAIVASNQAQAQLLHDMGVITMESLTGNLNQRAQ
jgi:outer membrane protein TolC